MKRMIQINKITEIGETLASIVDAWHHWFDQCTGDTGKWNHLVWSVTQRHRIVLTLGNNFLHLQTLLDNHLVSREVSHCPGFVFVDQFVSMFQYGDIHPFAFVLLVLGSEFRIQLLIARVMY